MASEWCYKNQNSSYRVNCTELLVKGKEIYFDFVGNLSYLSLRQVKKKKNLRDMEPSSSYLTEQAVRYI